MTQVDIFVGIDVSKDRLDVFSTAGMGFAVPNDAAGLECLAARLAGVRAVALEASGGYELAALTALAGAGVAVYRLDPAQVRAFARSRGQRAKTDAIDARMIALCLSANLADLVPFVCDATTTRLAGLSAFRRRLVGQKAALAATLDRTSDPAVLGLMADHQAALAALIARTEAQIAACVNEEPALRDKAARLRSAPGVGPVLASTLIGALPELGRVGSRQIAALVGVAPYDRQSGRRARSARCAAGRGHIRHVLYMATLAAIRARKRPFFQTYERLRAAGKPTKVAITATMRKMIVILNAMLRDNATFAT